MCPVAIGVNASNVTANSRKPGRFALWILMDVNRMLTGRETFQIQFDPKGVNPLLPQKAMSVQ